MGNIWLLKRALPFLATFGLGLFVASFFVDMSQPRFEYRGYQRDRCRHELRDLRIERDQLREENLRLRHGQGTSDLDLPQDLEDEDLDSLGVDEPVLPPPPPRPMKPHHIHTR